MIQIIKKFIEANRLLPAFEGNHLSPALEGRIHKTPSLCIFVIVGFSGGGDSVSLLHILNRLGYHCIAAHCNFHLRGDESDSDEVFCRKFADKHQIKLEKIDFDTKAYAAQRRISIEMAARELRYLWFEALRSKYDAQAIAVAHHRNDSIETTLLNLIRGTGIHGLCGIRAKNGWVIRPLLCVGKDDINHYLTEHQLPYVTDSSNLTDVYTRNFIRLRLLPLIKEINPSIEESLTRTIAHLNDVESIYIQAVENIKKILLKKNDDESFQIPINELFGYTTPNTVLYELLRPFGFTSIQSENVYNSLSGVSGKIFDAPNTGFQLLKDRTSLHIYKKPENKTEIFHIEEKDTDTDFELPLFRLSFRKVEISQTFEIDKSSTTASFDYEKIRFPLCLRKWQAGDWFMPYGMKGRKKVSNYFSDHKFSLLQKQQTWLLCSEKDIIWVIGERTDNRFCINHLTKKALIIQFLKK